MIEPSRIATALPAALLRDRLECEKLRHCNGMQGRYARAVAVRRDALAP
jgi:hypothetical protein